MIITLRLEPDVYNLLQRYTAAQNAWGEWPNDRGPDAEFYANLIVTGELYAWHREVSSYATRRAEEAGDTVSLGHA